MSKIVVDKLPNDCDECPFFAYYYPPPHPGRNSMYHCPLKEEYPDCLYRFIELKELINAKTKETVSR